jgi:hypothetical protein
MELTPIGILILAIWALCAYRGILYAFECTLCMLPFGMASVVNLPAVGGMSLMAGSVCAALTIVLYVLQLINQRHDRVGIHIPNGGLPLIALGLYGIISATINVRLFAGDIRVFSLDRSATGSGDGIYGRLVPLQPNSGNISQTFYLLLSIAFFFVAFEILRKHGTQLLHRSLQLVALIHLCLAALDACALDSLLAPLRTANYELLSHHTIAGFPRVIGGFAEASAFGSFSTILCTYFAFDWIHRQSKRSALLACLLSVCIIASFSSTAYAGAFVLCAWLTAKLLYRLSIGQLSKTFALSGLGLCCLFGLAGLALLILSPVGESVNTVFSNLILDKAGSDSGQERGAWALSGFHTFIDTYGLGAGIGSIRSNGWASVYAGSVGMPGTACLLTFLYIILSSRNDTDSDVFIYPSAARAAIVINIVMRLLSSTTPDLGILMMSFAACCLTTQTKSIATNEPTPTMNSPSGSNSAIPSGTEVCVRA